MTVSATPVEALEREWHEHDLARYMKVIAGQEMRSKAEHVRWAAKGKYDDDHIMLIGDAPGDRDSAYSERVQFYSILPGSEAESWRRFREEALPRFVAGTRNREPGWFPSRVLLCAREELNLHALAGTGT